MGLVYNSGYDIALESSILNDQLMEPVVERHLWTHKSDAIVTITKSLSKR